MSSRNIQPVKDNSEKQLTYQNNMSRYNRAMNNGFFYEAIVIDYAMIEDRLLPMIYHMGFRVNRDKLKISGKNKAFLQRIVPEYKLEKESSTLGIISIAGKLKIVSCVYRWAAETEEDYSDNRYLSVLKSQIEGTDIGLMFTTIDEINLWKDYRNEVIHSLLNKNTAGMSEQLPTIAEEGMRLARILNNQNRILKSGNRIRRSCNMSMN